MIFKIVASTDLLCSQQYPFIKLVYSPALVSFSITEIIRKNKHVPLDLSS